MIGVFHCSWSSSSHYPAPRESLFLLTNYGWLINQHSTNCTLHIFNQSHATIFTSSQKQTGVHSAPMSRSKHWGYWFLRYLTTALPAARRSFPSLPDTTQIIIVNHTFKPKKHIKDLTFFKKNKSWHFASFSITSLEQTINHFIKKN